MRKSILLIFCLLTYTLSFAQAPKWMEKAKKAVFSIISYDKDGNILHSGNGFFISETGEALSDYSVFNGAQNAIILTPEGAKLNVSTIIGANEMYDITHFQVDINGKKVPSLNIAPTPMAANVQVYLLPYSTKKDKSFVSGTTKQVDALTGDYKYYTINLALKDKMVSCPLVDAQGNVIGLAQQATGKDTLSICYALDARYGKSLELSALSFNDNALRRIGIRKQLPKTEKDALTYLYMASAQYSADENLALIDDFIAQFPNSTDGYFLRANNNLYRSQSAESMAKVEADMDKGLECATKKDEAYFSRAKIIYTYVQTQPKEPYKGWNYDTAIDEISNAIKVSDQPVYTQMLAELQYAKGNYESALKAYEKVNKSDIATPATLYNILKVKEALRAPSDELLELADSLINKFTPPYTAEVAPYLFERAQLHMDQGAGRLAFIDYNEYEKAVKGQVNDVFYYYRSQAALLGRQYQVALDDIAKAIEMNPNEIAYYNQQALTNLRVNRNTDAIEILKTVVAKDPKNAEAYRLMGLAQLQSKKNKEACASLQKAQELGDEQAPSLLQKYCK